MKAFLFFAALSAGMMIGCLQPLTSVPSSMRMPAEYGPHAAVWLGWIPFEPYQAPFFALASALQPHVPLKVGVRDSAEQEEFLALPGLHDLDLAEVEVFILPDNRLWMRDHGATFLTDGAGKKTVVDFGWSAYGIQDYLERYFEGKADSVAHHFPLWVKEVGRIDSLMGIASGAEVLETEVVMEGGSIEVNGRGTLILCEAVTFQRNPGWEKAALEAEFKRVLGADRIIWMKEGLVEDPYHFDQIMDEYWGWGTKGHTDEFVRFANDSTILLAWVEEEEIGTHPFHEENARRMKENLQRLEAARDWKGRPFHIIKVPLPDPMTISTQIGETLDWSNRASWRISASWLPEKGMFPVGTPLKWTAASSYLNYLVTNEVVILPTYVEEGSSPEKEATVKAIFTEAFPNRELIFLPVMGFNFFGGGIHCVTQQEPLAQPSGPTS